MKYNLLFVLLITLLPAFLSAQTTFAIDRFYNGELRKFRLNDPVDDTILGQTDNGMLGGDFGPNGVLYAINAFSNNFYKIDTTDASYTLLGNATPLTNHQWMGLAYDETTGVLYAASTSQNVESAIYTISTADGTPTHVGTTTAAKKIGAIAFDDAGQMYAFDIYTDDHIFLIDKSNGSATMLGLTNSRANSQFYCGMDFCSDNQTMYITASNSDNGNKGELRRVDLTDGSSEFIAYWIHYKYGALITSYSLIADFTSDETTVCTDGTVQFTDLSINESTWSWTFNGGTPSSSTDQNPSVTYDTPGIYDVELTVSNTAGSKTETKYAYITVIESPEQPDTPSGEDEVCTGSTMYYTTNPVQDATTYTWEVDPVDAGTISGSDTIATFGAAVDWSGSFAVRVQAVNMCGDGEWSDALSCTLSASPDDFNLEGGGSYCFGDDGVEITLDGSQTGIDYELFLDGTTTGIIIAGTGSELSFGLLTEEGYYEAYGSNAECTTTMTGLVQVIVSYPPPEPSTPTGPEAICNEATSDYTSAGSGNADSYLWMISPEAAGTIYGTGLDATVTWNSEFMGTAMISLSGVNDCGEGNPSESLEVSVSSSNPQIVGEATVCDFSSEIYTVDEYEGSTYAWVVSGGEITEGQGTYMITIAWAGVGYGTISVEEETAGGCTGSSEEFETMIDDCTGLGESKAETNITIRPNSAKDYVQIISEHSLIGVTAINYSGEEVLSYQLSGKSERINTSSLSPGIYFLKINTNKGSKVLKLVIR